MGRAVAGPAGMILAIVKELRTRVGRRQLLVAGAPALAPLLAKELRAGGEAGAVLENDPLERALALVYVLSGEPMEDDVKALRRRRAGVRWIIWRDAARGRARAVRGRD